MNGTVYAAFGAHCDISPWYGWIAGVTETGTLQTMWTTASTPGDSGAGIMDAEGNVVAVVSLANESAEELSLPLAFSQKQLVAAGVTYVVQ